MTVYCGNISCKYNNDKNKCTAAKVSLTFEGIHTKHQGFREVLSCKTYEEDDFSKQVRGFLEENGIPTPPHKM